MLAVLGAGSWGSALAITIARNCQEKIYLWTIESEHADVMCKTRENHRYLPGIELPNNIVITSNLEQVVQETRDVLVVIPSHGIKQLFYALKEYGAKNIAWGTKGLVTGVGFIHELFTQIFATQHYAVVTGPSFAKEVAQQMPTSLTIGSPDLQFALRLQEYLQNEHLHTYVHDDVLGAELGGIIKNILAVACGIIAGLKIGANAQATIITHGLNESVRLAVTLGARASTLYGLAGMGDVVLTCMDNQSRNRRYGLLLAQGRGNEEAQKSIGQEVEAVNNAKLLMEIIKKHKIYVPIIEGISHVLMNLATIEQTLPRLLAKEHASCLT